MIKYKKGDKIKILRKDITQILAPYGTVTRQDGSNVYVKPIWYDHEIELYDTEIEIAKPFWAGYEKEKEKEKEETHRIVQESLDKYKHLDNCPVNDLHINGVITNVVIFALWRKEHGWICGIEDNELYEEKG